MQNGRKRLMSELKKLHKDPPASFRAEPLEENVFEWHFTIAGPEDSDFEGGIYHGKLKLPNEYPMKPPKIILLTPNGRWVINSKICLSISDFHPETWQPSWGIRTALTALRAFMPTPGKGAIGSLDASPEARKLLAQRSGAWKCNQCGACMRDIKKELDAMKTCPPAKKKKAGKSTIPDFADLDPSALKTTKPPTIVEDEDLKIDASNESTAENVPEKEDSPEENEAEGENNVASQNEPDLLNSLTLFLIGVIGSILIKKLATAFTNAL